MSCAVLFSCGSDDHGSSPPLAVLAAFPAELAALLDHAVVDDEVVIEGRAFRLGTLGGMPVVLGMTGIGLVNATTTTRALLDSVEVGGVVVSGVAGSSRRIGDVTVPLAWSLAGDTATYAAAAAWIELAREVAASGVALETCTVPASRPEAGVVCVRHEPAIFVGGTGETSDPFPGVPYVCRPSGGDVFGCDAVDEAPVAASRRSGSGATQAPEEPAAVDMETAAIAREATTRGLPFIAFRAVSDGEGDPLNLPGFPDQFFAYYNLAARNAAAAVAAFLERLHGG